MIQSVPLAHTGEHRKWWVLAIISLGLFMILLDVTIVNVALPRIMGYFQVSLPSIEWVVTWSPPPCW